MEEQQLERMTEETSGSSHLMKEQKDVTVIEQVSNTGPRKPSSLLLEQNENSGFWTNSARNSVISLTETESLSLATEAADNTTESARGFLIQKGSSLSHTPDIVRVFEKDCVKQTNSFHEFQKVKSELRHVDDMNSPTEIRRFSQSVEFMKRNKEMENESSSDIIENKDVIIQESTEELKALKVLDETLHEGVTTHERIRSVSKDMIIDLIPGKVKLDESDKQMK